MIYKKRKKKKKDKDIDVDQIMLKDRTLFIHDDVKFKIVEDIVKKLYALDKVNHKEIKLYICTYGGVVEAGFAVIDAIRRVKSKVTTIITGIACSMGSMISVVGNKRLITKTSCWMAHPMRDLPDEYTSFARDRIKNWDDLEKIVESIYKDNTNLTKKEIAFIKRGELWLNAKEAVKKGIADKIV